MSVYLTWSYHDAPLVPEQHGHGLAQAAAPPLTAESAYVAQAAGLYRVPQADGSGTIAAGWLPGSIARQVDVLAGLLFAGAKDQAETVTTTFGAGTITEVYTNLGVTRTTTFNGDGSITESYTGALARTKVTTFGVGGSITETIT